MIDDAMVFDMHGHTEGLLPAGTALRSSVTPADTAIGNLKSSGLDGCIVCAVGDTSTFGLLPRDCLHSVKLQLDAIKSKVANCGGTVLALPGQAAALDNPANQPIQVMLGVEGLDFLDGSLDMLDALFDMGVRVVGLVHYTASAIGGLCMDLRGNPEGWGTQGGLSTFGKSVVARANQLGMIIDVAHANADTVRDVLDCSARPILCSHTGPYALGSTPRYLTDEQLHLLAQAGGMVGLWPGRVGKAFPEDCADFCRMIEHAVMHCGVDAVAIGTDFNGVPAYPGDYSGPADNGSVLAGLRALGMSATDVRAVAGDNALRFVTTALAG
jgi:membrane dipeptidase